MRLTPSPGLLATPSATAHPVSRTSLMMIALAMLAPFALYVGTAQSIVSIWNSSETFAHGYLIVPISLWLVWRQRAQVAALPATPYWPALALLALAGAGWLLARVGDVQVVQQYAFVAMLPLIALGVLGRRLAAALAFPLLFLLLAVPFGDIFIEPLIGFTADFTVRAVQLTGIPVLRNGTHFEIPSGSWSVVEACSGVRYLISSVTIGCLYAYLTYRSTARRLLFMVVSIIVPIIANGVRAYLIVMIGHLSSMTLATDVDHLIYGWLFFGLVMFMMFWIGSYWREDMAATATAMPALRGAAAAVAERPRGGAAMALALVAMGALWPALALLNERANHNPQPVALQPVAVGWASAPAFSTWVPRFMAPDAAFHGVYQAPRGTPVALTLLYYRNQNSSKSLISSVNRLTGEKEAYHQSGSSLRLEAAGAGQLALRETVVQGLSANLLVWQWLWIDGRTTASNYVGKLWQAEAKLRLRGDDGAALMLSAPYGDQPDAARAALRAFLAAHIGAIDAALAATRQH